MDGMPKFMHGKQVGLLIGSNCAKALQPIRVIPSVGDGPFAIKYLHGWTINEPLEVRYDSQARIQCNRVFARETRVKEIPTSDVLSILNQDFADLDQPDALHDLGPSQDDKQFMSIVQSQIKHVDGHFVMPLPFKDPNFRFPPIVGQLSMEKVLNCSNL